MLKSKLVWNNLKPLLEEFSSKILRGNFGSKCSIGHSGNEFFLLRAYCSLFYEAGGDEIAITVDVKNEEKKYAIELDIVGSNNEILGTHSFLILKADSDAKFEERVNIWILGLSEFLSEKFDVVNNAVGGLK